mmetsp:Transcript_2056/g.5637  ORF Transcript_2056/g.5637 Transcript_2056/m.5637 type:complete len:399 (+) Transcript_2056:891-2087(+)
MLHIPGICTAPAPLCCKAVGSKLQALWLRPVGSSLVLAQACRHRVGCRARRTVGHSKATQQWCRQTAGSRAPAFHQTIGNSRAVAQVCHRTVGSEVRACRRQTVGHRRVTGQPCRHRITSRSSQTVGNKHSLTPMLVRWDSTGSSGCLSRGSITSSGSTVQATSTAGRKIAGRLAALGPAWPAWTARKMRNWWNPRPGARPSATAQTQTWSWFHKCHKCLQMCGCPRTPMGTRSGVAVVGATAGLRAGRRRCLLKKASIGATRSSSTTRGTFRRRRHRNEGHQRCQSASPARSRVQRGCQRPALARTRKRSVLRRRTRLAAPSPRPPPAAGPPPPSSPRTPTRRETSEGARGPPARGSALDCARALRGRLLRVRRRTGTCWARAGARARTQPPPSFHG